MNCRIEIKGLSNGEHRFRFPIDGSFFEAYENDSISDAALEVEAVVEKEQGRMGMRLSINGDVTVRCDRCLAELKLPVDVDAPFSIVFSSYGADEDETSDEVIVLEQSSGELDLSQIIYDYVCLSLPIKRVHPTGQCDPEMMEKMKDILK